MYILLSSTKRKRYREDILRCLSAPAGEYIQFRYINDIVSQPILDNPKPLEGSNAIICSICLEKDSEPCLIIPVRFATIQTVNLVGSTVCVTFKVHEFIAADPVVFTPEIANLSNNLLPKKVSRDGELITEGKFFFKLSSAPTHYTKGMTVDIWEKTVESLCINESYKKEIIFWTVIGLFEGKFINLENINQLRDWPLQLSQDKDYTLLVYVYHPEHKSLTQLDGVLKLISFQELVTEDPFDVHIDSPYDIKKWTFQIKSSDVRIEKGWISLSLESKQEESSTWYIDLPINVKTPWLKVIWIGLLLGVLIAGPSLVSIFTSSGQMSEKIIQIVCALLLGISAAFVAIFNIKKLP